MAFFAVIKRRSAVKSYGTPFERGIQLMRRFSNVLESDSKEEAYLRYIAPTSLEELVATSHFSRQELKLLYRSFKHAFPMGRITLEHLTEALSAAFPDGDPSSYAQILFNKLDINANGCVTFSEFIHSLSIINRGTDREKLQWVFDLYDLDQDERIDYNELCKLIWSVHQLREGKGGRKASIISVESNRSAKIECSNDYVAREASLLMQKFDVKRQGFVRKEDFLTVCLEDGLIASNLALFSMPLTSCRRLISLSMGSESQV